MKRKFLARHISGVHGDVETVKHGTKRKLQLQEPEAEYTDIAGTKEAGEGYQNYYLSEEIKRREAMPARDAECFRKPEPPAEKRGRYDESSTLWQQKREESLRTSDSDRPVDVLQAENNDLVNLPSGNQDQQQYPQFDVLAALESPQVEVVSLLVKARKTLDDHRLEQQQIVEALKAKVGYLTKENEDLKTKVDYLTKENEGLKTKVSYLANGTLCSAIWTLEQDQLLYNYQLQYGNHWVKIAPHIQGKTPRQCVSRYNSVAYQSRVKEMAGLTKKI